jgi:hypothetical protein
MGGGDIRAAADGVFAGHQHHRIPGLFSRTRGPKVHAGTDATDRPVPIDHTTMMDTKAIQSRLQTLIDTDPSLKGIASLSATLPGIVVVNVKPTPTPVVPPAAPPAPVVKVITQDKSTVRHDIQPTDLTPYHFANEQVTDGGFVRSRSTAPITIDNCSNQKGNGGNGGIYFLLLWADKAADGSQRACSKAVVNATGCTIYQSPNEAATRLKCDDFTQNGGTYKSHIKPDGTPVKPVVEVRHGKSIVFNDVDFGDGYMEVGQQWIR